MADGRIRIKSRKSQISTIGLDLFSRNHLKIAFKCKLYKEDMNKKHVYFHNEYKFKSNRATDDISLTLNPNSFIVFTGTDNEKVKHTLILNETYKHIFTSTIGVLAKRLISYLSGNDSALFNNGKLIASPDLTGVIKLSGKSFAYETIVRESTSDLGVRVILNNDFITEITILDFCEMFFKISSLNFNQTTMSLINYLGMPEDPENYCLDMRKNFYEHVVDDKDDDMSVVNMGTGSVFSSYGLEDTGRALTGSSPHKTTW
jgi:hypothetical protein